MTRLIRRRSFRTRHALVLTCVALFGWANAPATPQEKTALAPPAPIPAAKAPPSINDRPSQTVPLRRAALPGPYPVEVLKVLDGDTFEARVRIWFGQEITTLVRIRGIDAPELKARCGDELRGALASRDALAELLASGRPQLHNIVLDKYGGRVVASIRVEGTSEASDVAATMIASGWARPYNGGKRDAWCPLPPAKG